MNESLSYIVTVFFVVLIGLLVFAWTLLPILILRAISRLGQQQKRTNELLEWLGTVAQQEKGIT